MMMLIGVLWRDKEAIWQKICIPPYIFMHALEIAVFSSCLNGGRVTAIDGRYAGIEDK